MRELLDYCRSILNFNVCFAVVLAIVLCAKVTVRFVLKYVLYAGPFLHQWDDFVSRNQVLSVVLCLLAALKEYSCYVCCFQSFLVKSAGSK